MRDGSELLSEIVYLLDQNYTPLAAAQALDIPPQWVYNALRWTGREDYDHTDQMFQSEH